MTRRYKPVTVYFTEVLMYVCIMYKELLLHQLAIKLNITISRDIDVRCALSSPTFPAVASALRHEDIFIGMAQIVDRRRCELLTLRETDGGLRLWVLWLENPPTSWTPKRGALSANATRLQRYTGSVLHVENYTVEPHTDGKMGRMDNYTDTQWTKLEIHADPTTHIKQWEKSFKTA